MMAPSAEVSGPNVVRLEWHKMYRSENRLTSHSWLQMFLSDGTSSTLEFLCDPGFSFRETSTSAAEDSITLYSGLVALDFVEPLTVKALRAICHAKAGTRYSTLKFNCHHWALEVWNSVVPSSMRQSTYPDKWKAILARYVGLSKLLDPKYDEDSGASGGLLLSCGYGVFSWWLGEIA